VTLELTDEERALLHSTREQFVLMGAVLIPQLLNVIHKLQARANRAEHDLWHEKEARMEELDELRIFRCPDCKSDEQWLEAAKEKLRDR